MSTNLPVLWVPPVTPPEPDERPPRSRRGRGLLLLAIALVTTPLVAYAVIGNPTGRLDASADAASGTSADVVAAKVVAPKAADAAARPGPAPATSGGHQPYMAPTKTAQADPAQAEAPAAATSSAASSSSPAAGPAPAASLRGSTSAPTVSGGAAAPAASSETSPAATARKASAAAAAATPVPGPAPTPAAEGPVDAAAPVAAAAVPPVAATAPAAAVRVPEPAAPASSASTATGGSPVTSSTNAPAAAPAAAEAETPTVGPDGRPVRVIGMGRPADETVVPPGGTPSAAPAPAPASSLASVPAVVPAAPAGEANAPAGGGDGVVASLRPGDPIAVPEPQPRPNFEAMAKPVKPVAPRRDVVATPYGAQPNDDFADRLAAIRKSEQRRVTAPRPSVASNDPADEEDVIVVEPPPRRAWGWSSVPFFGGPRGPVLRAWDGPPPREAMDRAPHGANCHYHAWPTEDMVFHRTIRCHWHEDPNDPSIRYVR